MDYIIQICEIIAAKAEKLKYFNVLSKSLSGIYGFSALARIYIM